MIDHVLGRPSSKSRRLQVLAVLAFWGAYLLKGHRHGPPLANRLSRLVSLFRLTPWQTTTLTILTLYAARNLSALLGLASPEPMAAMYDPAFFRATWVLTALDAGFWTAMRIRRKWLRDLASILFSAFYLVAAERADEKVRKVRGMLTVDHLRVSWNKGTTPYLRFFQGLLRPRLTRWPPRQVRVPRPAGSDYTEPVMGWLYFDGPLTELRARRRLVLDVPGGGFVAMDPRCNDDKLFAWTAKSGLPVLSLDYKKAPEFPYPYALNECFDVYRRIMETRGRCIGMSGDHVPQVVLSGDSAGGNLAVATTLMILEAGSQPPSEGHPSGSSSPLPPPDGLVCFYPALDMNIGNWMTDEQMALIRDRKARKTNKPIVKRKSMQYGQLAGTPHHSDAEDEDEMATPATGSSREPAAGTDAAARTDAARRSREEPTQTRSSKVLSSSAPASAPQARPLETRLATSSIISYFNDRVLTPELMRAMIILYIGPHNRPDFSRDYLLSPVLAPDALLDRFPKTFLMTGERDPLVDDTVIFAGRVRRAKEARRAREARGTDLGRGSDAGDAGDVEVVLLPGTSHGFMQFPSVYPPAWKHFARSAGWFVYLFDRMDRQRGEALAEAKRAASARAEAEAAGTAAAATAAAAAARAESSGEEDRPLEMSMTRGRGGSLGGGQHGPRGENGRKTTGDGERGGQKKERRRGSGSGRVRKSRSLVKLSSEDDLLRRRMQGLTSGLTGAQEG